ncbi:MULTISPECIES: hypothetical protein [Moraxella]|jgi:hypothetical protein|uniref:Uncharacterized protein n=1 Tax=Moraxella lacunata TaxID=477 RepID=A0A1B8Q4R7_MORLA|nr:MULTISPECIES: hypothetical protein [Moraxella]MBE9578407.1 hypothetical protein [Moraxella sp. K1664]MBE9587783.1 hypothetical protein [Moraxella sp. K1630]MBE9590939.1 hypothetical protein [Moraxella sp. K127]MBE9596877.1 hypothetical protein [Moraxella sp. K2450]MDH9218298.1 hypothetical protein [Moraxella lacunata]
MFNLSNHQYHIAISLYLLQLEMMSRDEIFDFNNQLMSLGYYDELMLIVLDEELTIDKQSNTNLNVFELKSLMLKICKNLNFYCEDLPFKKCELKYIHTLNEILKYTYFPIEEDSFNLYDYYENHDLYHEDIIIPVTHFMYYLEPYFDCTPPIDETQKTIYNFCQACQNWISNHHEILTQIFSPFKDNISP